MSSAQRTLDPLDEARMFGDAAAPASSLNEPFALKEQVAQRLAAHRARRGQTAAPTSDAHAPQTPARARTSKIAAAVAERYAQQQSYHAFLAAEAERSIREAEAAAEIAAINARAIADAQFRLLEELDAQREAQYELQHEQDPDHFALTPPTPITLVPKQHEDSMRAHRVPAVRETDEPLLPLLPAVEAVAAVPALTVRLADHLARPLIETPTTARRAHGDAPGGEFVRESMRESVYAPVAATLDEALALEEEIAFRQAPVFDPVTAPIDIPANLIEFPRQLVAARKARPRLAEGPLREEADDLHDPQAAQLRIFEVEAEQISPAPPVSSAEPEWTSILLAAHPISEPVAATEPQFVPTPAPQAAAFNLRLMACLVDSTIVASALLAFLTAATLIIERIAPAARITLPALGIAAVVTFAFLTLAYQMLFFTFSEATPGMRYARIGLCTLSDDNPTRAAMRRRILAGLLATCPLGIGFLWAFLDEDGLGWHDRISRMYQRAY